MLRRLAISGLACVIWLGALNEEAEATFHFWDIREVYSNADGSVQFIELFTASNNQQFTINTSITASFNANTFVFPSNTPFPTAGQRLLLATAGFESLPGGVMPDFNIPANFFNPVVDVITYVGTAFPARMLSNTPTDGLNSASFPGNVVGINSPTNFAGDVGKLVTLGDMNEDGAVNSFDVAPFIQALTDRPAFDLAYPMVDADLVGNVNGDSLFDLGDIAEFELLVNASSAMAVAQGVPEPSTLLIAAMLISGLIMIRRRRCQG